MDIENALGRRSDMAASLQDGTETDGFNLAYALYTPKWKWFRPPLWRIFRWAYRINITLYLNCAPVVTEVRPEDIAFTIEY